MKKSFACQARANFVWLVIVPLLLIAPAASTIAAELKEAHVTRIIKDVQLLPSQAAPRPAVVNDNVRSGTAVRTGADSRTELTFSDLTLARLGANTIFSFNEGTRNLDLGGGAVLLHVPKGAGGAKITTAAITAGITGTTVLMEYHRDAYIKFIVLEGTARMYLKNHLGESVLIGPGQMLIVKPNATSLPDPVTVDLKRLFETCLLITEFAPLASQSLILQQIQIQQNNPDLIPTNVVIYGRGTLVSLVDPTNVNVLSQRTAAIPTPTPSPTPVPTPSKFGTPSVITSPDPYVITSGTTISTDPTITTNGVTDFGKIWRGPVQDGPLSAFIFGSTSAFDIASGFDAELNGQNSMGGAVFKFTSLQLTGNPTISTPTGVINLGLIAVNGITSGGPGGILTFAGIRGLLLATQDGSINLGPEISFSGIHDINFYARGAGSNLTLGSAISGGMKIRLWAQGTIQINGHESATDFKAFSGGDFLAGSGTITAQTIDIESCSNINIDSRQFPNPTGDVTFKADGTLNATLHPGSGGTTHFHGTSLTARGNTINLQSSVNPTTFDLGTATVSFKGGSGGIQAPDILFANGSSLLLQTTSGGDINIYGTQNGANDTIRAGGAFSAQSDVSALTIQAGTINVGGDLSAGSITVGTGGIHPFVTSPGGASVQHTFNVDSIVSSGGIDFSGNQFDGIGGLSSGGRLTINATTITFDPATGIALANFNGADTGSFSNGGPASGGDGGTFIVNTTGNITANNGADITATTGLNTDSGVFSGAGGNVTLHSSGGSITVDQRIEVSSDDPDALRQSASGGNITLHSDLTTGQGITVRQSASLLSLLDAEAPGPGGSILLSTKGADITIQGGTIEADRGTITISQMHPVNQTPTITIDGATLTSEILTITGAGDINLGSNSPVTLNVVTLSLSATNNLTWSGGTLSAPLTDSNASVDIVAGQAIHILNDLSIARSSGGTIGGMDVTLQAGTDLSIRGNLSTTLRLDLIDTGGNTTITAGHDITVGNTLSLNTEVVTNTTHGADIIGHAAGGALSADKLEANILVDSGVTLGAGGDIDLRAGGNLITTGTSNTDGIVLTVDNRHASIGTGGNISLISTGGNLMTDGGGIALTIQNTTGTINNGGNITLMVDGSVSTQGALDVTIDNSNGGTIRSDATLTVNAGNIPTAGNFNETINNSMGGNIVGSANLNFNLTGNLITQGDASFEILNNGGSITSNAIVDIRANNISVGGSLNAYIDNTGGTIDDSGGTLTLHVNGAIMVTNQMNVLGTVTAGGDITAGTLSSTDVMTNPTTGSIIVGSGGITRFSIPGEPIENIQHTLTAASITSQGGINFNGIDGTGTSAPTTGGQLTINVNSLNIGTDIVGSVTFNGGTGVNSGTGGASGGTFTVNTNGSIAVNSDVEATTGLQDINAPPAGNGGTVNLNSSNGAVLVNSIVEASSAPAGADQTFVRRSATGGNINITSGKATGVAVNISGSGELLSLLDTNAPGPGGVITVMATGATSNSSSINVSGTVEADRGTIDIEHAGDNGQINISNASLQADIVKSRVFGANGQLNIGGGFITPATLLKLYAPGSNGQLNFTSNVTLSVNGGGNSVILAANAVTIVNNVVVDILGPGPADVFTNNANYTGFGGNGSTTGTFAANGANNPRPLSQAPPFGPGPSRNGGTANTDGNAQTLSSTNIASSGKINGNEPRVAARKPTPVVMNVSNTNQLLSLLDSAAPGPGGKITIPAPKIPSNSRNPSRINAAGRPKADRGALDIQTASSLLARHLPQ